MKRQLMAEQWDQFARAVLPKETSAVQRQEMRRAFYAGGHAILFRLVAVLAPDTEPTAEDIQVLEDIYQEMNAFGEAIQQGRA